MAARGWYRWDTEPRNDGPEDVADAIRSVWGEREADHVLDLQPG